MQVAPQVEELTLQCGECSVVLGSQRCRRVSRRRRLALVSPMNNYRASSRGALLTRSVSEGDTRRGVPPVEQTFQDGFWIDPMSKVIWVQ